MNSFHSWCTLLVLPPPTGQPASKEGTLYRKNPNSLRGLPGCELQEILPISLSVLQLLQSTLLSMKQLGGSDEQKLSMREFCWVLLVMTLMYEGEGVMVVFVKTP